MTIIAELATHLRSKPSLTTLIGNAVYSKRAPHGVGNRYVLLSKFGGDPKYSLTGEVGTTHSILQVSCWARDPNGAVVANQIGDAIRNLISGFRGEWGDTFVSDCSLTSEPTEQDEAPDDGSDRWWHGVSQDYRVTHAQFVPALN